MSRSDYRVSEHIEALLFEDASGLQKTRARLAASAASAAALAGLSNVTGYAGPWGDTVMAAPPTYSLSAANAASTIASPQEFPSIVSAAPSNKFTYWGGNPARSGVSNPDDNLVIFNSLHVSNGTKTGRYEFMHHGRYLDIRVHGGGFSNQIYVDGQAIAANASAQVPSLTPAADGNLYRIILDFGSVALRKVALRTANKFRGVTGGPNDTILPTGKGNAPLAIGIGDSFMEGTGVPVHLGFFPQLAARMGWDGWISGSGGTGYIATNGARGNFASRIVEDCLQYNPDIVLVAGGINDQAQGATATTAAAIALFDQIQAAGVPLLIVVGPFYPTGSPPAFTTTLNANLKADVQARPGAIYLDPHTPSVITGTGKVGATTGTGNADLMTQNDGTHPTQAGQSLYAAWAYNQLAKAAW